MLNIIPLNDEKGHEHSGDCWCEPRLEWQHSQTGEIYANGPIIVHNSADCREAVEKLLNEGVSKAKKWATYVR